MNRPLRIAVFVGVFPEPSETFIRRQIIGLMAQGHTVDIYADVRSDPAGPVLPEVAQHGLLERTTFIEAPLECIPWEMPAWPEEGETWVPGASAAPSNRERLRRAEPVRERCLGRWPELTRRVLSEEQSGYRARSLSGLYRLDRLGGLDRAYDVLHAHFGPVGESYRFARELWRAPFVVSFHGYDFCTVPRREGRDCYARLFAEADRILVNSEYTRGRVEGLGCPPEKVRKLPMGLDPAQFDFRERTGGTVVRLITVARLVEIKGHEFMLRAVAEVRRRRPGLRYEIVGDGPLRGRLEALTDALRLRDIVRFHGTLTGAGLATLRAESQVGLQCSVSVDGDEEGQGLALLEAQACGLPVMATRHGAFSEAVLDGRTGWLVPERDASALAGQIDRAIEAAREWPAMGRAGREFACGRFAQNDLNKQLAEIYREIIIARQTPPVA